MSSSNSVTENLCLRDSDREARLKEADNNNRKVEEMELEREHHESSVNYFEDEEVEEEGEDIEDDSDTTEGEFSSSDSEVRRGSVGDKTGIKAIINIIDLHKGMADLECLFTKARGLLYKERLALVKKKIENVKNGTSPELMKTTAKLQEELKERTEIAEILYEKQMDAIRIKKDAFELCAKQDFEERKKIASDKIRDKIQQKAFDLEMERVDARERKWLSGAKREKKRKELVGKKRVREITQPYIIYEVEEDDIAEDVRIIERNIAAMEYGIIL